MASSSTSGGSEIRHFTPDLDSDHGEGLTREVGAFIVDPLMTRAGVIPPPDGALEAIAEACARHSILLIFDERVSGFRVHRGGMSARAGVTRFRASNWETYATK